MKLLHAALFLSLLGVGHAEYITNPSPICKDVKLSLTTTADNYALPPYPNSTAKTAIGDYIKSFNASTLPKNNRVSGTFNIAATYCVPANKVPEREGTIQLLLHGLAYTKVSSFLILL